MRAFLIFISLFSSLFALTSSDVQAWYDNGQYNRVCTQNVRDLLVSLNSDGLINLYAKSCLKQDRINDLIVPIVMLYKNRAARENAAYYSTILYQKKLLYMAINDGVDIGYVNLPKTDYVLSYIFERFVKKEYTFSSGRYIFVVSPTSRYELFLKTEDGISKMILATFLNAKLDSIKTYW